MWQNSQLLIRLKQCENEVNSEKSIIEAKDMEMETLR